MDRRNHGTDSYHQRPRGAHLAEVRVISMKYYGTDQDPRLTEPLDIVITRDRLWAGYGYRHRLRDRGHIRNRMQASRELFRGQSFPGIDVPEFGAGPRTGHRNRLDDQNRSC